MLRIDERDVVAHLSTPVDPLHGIALWVGFDGGILAHENGLGWNLFGSFDFGQVGTEQQPPRLQFRPSWLQLTQVGVERQKRAENQRDEKKTGVYIIP